LLRFHRESDRISQEVIEALGGQILDVDGVLKSAAKGLRSLGYRRVFFSLIDPKERFIRGAWDECEDPVLIWLATATGGCASRLRL